jgi:hypothetical protein
VFATLRRRAAWDGIADGRSGAVTILQRFGKRIGTVTLDNLARDQRGGTRGF